MEILTGILMAQKQMIKPHWRQKMLSFLIDDVSLTVYAVFFAIFVLLLSGLYFYLTPGGNGIESDACQTGGKSFLNCVYFSIVTVATLGYGDLRPIGYSRLFACI